MDSNPYIADGSHAAETLRAIGSALVGLKPGDPVIFVVGEDGFAASWNSWLARRFLPTIAPHIISVREACHSVSPREVVSLDSQFSTLLDPAESSRSIRAANLLKGALAGARHRPELDKVVSLLNSQGTPTDRGHFPTLLAARCASHHISLASSLAAYLYFECVSSLQNGTPDDLLPASAILPSILPAVRSALDARPPSSYRVA